MPLFNYFFLLFTSVISTTIAAMPRSEKQHNYMRQSISSLAALPLYMNKDTIILLNIDNALFDFSVIPVRLLEHKSSKIIKKWPDSYPIIAFTDTALSEQKNKVASLLKRFGFDFSRFNNHKSFQVDLITSNYAGRILYCGKDSTISILTAFLSTLYPALLSGDIPSAMWTPRKIIIIDSNSSHLAELSTMLMHEFSAIAPEILALHLQAPYQAASTSKCTIS